MRTPSSRTCIVPLSDAAGAPLYDGVPFPHAGAGSQRWYFPRGTRRKCGKPVPARRPERLCDEHYAPVSDEAIKAFVALRLST